jgi:MFS family permease
MTSIYLGSGFAIPFWIAGALAGSAGLLAFFLPRPISTGQRADRTSRPFRLFTQSAVYPGFIAGIAGLAVGAFITYSPVLAREFGAENSGLFISIYALANIPSRLLVGPISDRHGRFWAVVPGILMVTAGIAVLGFLRLATYGLLAPILLGLGMGIFAPGVLAWSVDISPPSEKANAASTVLVIWEIFVFLGISLQGFGQALGEPDLGYQVMALLLILTTGVVLREKHRLQGALIT